MPRFPLRLFSAALLLAAIGSLLVWDDSLALARQKAVARQRILPAGPGGKKKEEKKSDKDLRPEEDWDVPFAPPYERDATSQLRGARDYLAFKDPPWKTIVPLLQNILNAKSDSFFNVKDKAGGKLLTRPISVRTEANRIISAFPKEGLEFYQQSYGQDAVNLLTDAIRHNYDLAMLSDVSQRYFHAKAGAEATILLGSLYLQRGNYLEAAYAFERLIARPNSEEFLTGRTLFKAAMAFKRSGDPHHAALAKRTSEQLQKATSKDGLVIGRRTFTFDLLKAEIERPVTSIRETYSLNEWNGRYGNAQRNGLVDGGPPFLVPAFKPAEMLFSRSDEDREANDWILERLNRLFDRENKTLMNKSLPLPGFFPVTTPDMVVFRSYDGVHAVATRDHTALLDGEPKLVRAGETKWIWKVRVGLHPILTPNVIFMDSKVRESTKQWWEIYKSPTYQASSILYENPLIGSLSHDGHNVYFLDDLAIPPPPSMGNPNRFGGFPGGQPIRQSGELADASRASQLVAVNLNSGLMNWSLGRVIVTPYSQPPALPRLSEEEADKSTNAFHLCLNAVFLGPPLTLNGRLYVLIELDGVMRLLCLDPKTLEAVKEMRHTKVPKLIWSQKLGRPNQTLPGDSIRRFQGSFLAAGEGIIICPTNSGMFVGVDIMSRSLLWARGYRKLAAPKSPVYDPNTGMVKQPGSELPADRWHAAAPIVSGGRAVLASYDSPKLECLDIRTGRVLWSTPRQSEDLYVGGIVNEKVIVVGKTTVRAYNLSGEAADLTPSPAWGGKAVALSGATPTGHGIASKTMYYLPVRPNDAGKGNTPAAEIWAINLKTGAIASKTGARIRKDGDVELARFGLGNLVFQDGLVIAQSAYEVAVYPQLEAKKAEMDRLLKANPKDPKGLFNRGELNLDDGKVAEAIADFKSAQSNNPSNELKANLRDKLYVAFTELLREKFPDGEKYLEEYHSLCTVPTEPDLEPFEATRRKDETLRRQRLYYYLLAKGREGQKRLGDAFDNYLKLATLGEGRTLFEMPDEPSVRMRPDVWARGRIEGMIRRATDPESRKSLELRVNKQWEQVQAKNDRKSLQEFVDVFGPYFPAGAQAGLRLAELLINSGNEEDGREAQVHLSKLRATAEDPVVRARATEALARVMIKGQLMEDAVGLYLQLGKEFPAVEIRDGKTGADFLTDLLTDRRLLPYLETSRYPLPTKVKAEQQNGQRSNMSGTFEVEPEGRLFPMYRRQRFVIDMTSSGNNTWTLRGYDRTSGVERCRFTGIAPPMPYNPGNWQSARHLQASGHLLLLQVGSWIHCLDLAEKKERWRKNLLGDGLHPQPNQIFDNGNGEVYLNYTNGWRQPIGGIAAIQPGYVALLTRDGLEVIEPNSRRMLWKRRHVADKTRIHGDARFILLVENGANGKPVSTRLLRAIDGLTVEKSKDAGRILADAKNFKIFGHTVLLHESAANKEILRLLDLSTGKDVWRKEADDKAVAIQAIDDEWTGFVHPNREVEVLSSATGNLIGRFKLDEKYGPEHLKDCGQAQLFADPDRFYLVLDREPNGAFRTTRKSVYAHSLRTQPVNGPMYAFDRATSKMLWFVQDVLDHQWLVQDRFAELPVLIAAAPIPAKNGVVMYRMVIIEKDQGAIRFNKGIGNNGRYFHNITIDLKNGEIDVHRDNTRIRITRLEPQK